MLKNNRYFKQGDIFFVSDVGDTLGTEQKFNRPCIILSVDSLNKNRESIVVAPITSKGKKPMVTHYILKKSDYPCLLYDENIILLENISDVSIWRLGRKLGKLNKEDLAKLIEMSQYIFKDFYIDNKHGVDG